jgi:hypothetical protein
MEVISHGPPLETNLAKIWHFAVILKVSKAKKTQNLMTMTY